MKDVADLFRVGKKLFELIQQFFPTIVQVEVITYRDAIEYFITNRPADARVAKGAIIVKRRTHTMKTLWVFLDEKNGIVNDATGKPYGRQLIVNTFDEELSECFAGTDLLVFE
jgi:hypothetical protein